MDREPAVAEGDDADCHRLRLGLDEGPGRRLGGLQSGGLQVRGSHAARDVEREDDRPLEPGEAHDALRSGEGDDQDREADHEQRRSEGPADARPTSRGERSDAQAAERGRLPAPQTIDGSSGKKPDRDQCEKDEGDRPDE